MKTVTNEGNPIYPDDDPIRQAIPQESVCKHCKNLGDNCLTLERVITQITPQARAVTKCEGVE